MDVFYLTLTLTSLSVLILLAQMFFVDKLKLLFARNWYRRAFNFFAGLALIGILATALASLSFKNHTKPKDIATMKRETK